MMPEKDFFGHVRVMKNGTMQGIVWKTGLWSFEFDDFHHRWLLTVKEILNNRDKPHLSLQKEIFKTDIAACLNFPCQPPRGKTFTLTFNSNSTIFLKATKDEEVPEIFNFIKFILSPDNNNSIIKLSKVVQLPSKTESKTPIGVSRQAEKMDITTVQNLILNESPNKDSSEFNECESENQYLGLTKLREPQSSTITTRSESNRTPKKFFQPVTDTVIRITDKENKNRTPPPLHAVASTSSTGRTPLSDKSSTSSSIATSQFYGKNNDSTSSNQLNQFLLPQRTYSMKNNVTTRRAPSKRQPLAMSKDTPPKRKRLNNENDALWKPSYSTPPSKTPLLGFSNLGNTCYMNAILQALFGLEVFTKELLKAHTFFKEHLCDELLFSSLPQLLKYRNSSSRTTKDELLFKVKSAISASATRFSGYSQHDAHEFLEQVLDQLKEEVKKLTEEHSSSASNPIEANLEFTVSHSIECQNCQNSIVKEENFNDLSLDLPISLDDDDHPTSLQKMIDKFFRTEQVQYKCELCSADASVIRHRFTKLPRILILHIKRYAFDSVSSTSLKSANTIIIPKYLTLCRHRDDDVKQFLDVSESTKKIITFEDPPETPIKKIFDFPSLSSLMAPKTPQSASSKAKRRLYDIEGGGDSPPLNGSRTSPTNGRYELRPKSIRPNYSDAFDDVDPFGKQIEVGTEVEPDEDAQLKEALERSMIETGPPMPLWPVPLDDIPIDDDERSFQNDLQKAIQISLLDDANQSNGIPAEYLMDSGDPPMIGDVDPSTNGTSYPQVIRASLDENVPVEAENVDVELEEHAIKGNLPDAFRFCGVVTHLGSMSNTGHYVSDVYDAKKKLWRSFDDCRVTDTTEEDVQNERQKTGYIFFYVAKKIVDEEES